MNTANNFKIEIRTSGTETDSTIGLVSGVYKWALRAENTFADCLDTIISRDGWQSVSRAIDTRTGGGNSTQKSQKLTMIAGFYTKILDKAPIEGLRMQVYRETYIGDEWFDEVIYTGQVTTVDVQGDANIVNYTVESLLRDVALSNSVTAVGDVAIEGTVTGEKNYISLEGYDAYFESTNSSFSSSPEELTLSFIGRTPTLQTYLEIIIINLNSAIARGENAYYEGSEGTYKISSAQYFGTPSPSATIKVTLGNSNNLLISEVGETGKIFTSTEVFNAGLDGGVVVTAGNTELELDDYNTNIQSYQDGSAVASSDGMVYHRLINNTDYTAKLDEWLPFEDIGFTQVADGVSLFPTGSTADTAYSPTPTSALDWDRTTQIQPLAQSATATMAGLGYSIELDMTSYVMRGDRLYCVVDVESYGNITNVTLDLEHKYRLSIATFEGGDTSTEPQPSEKVGQIDLVSTRQFVAGFPLSANSMPSKYTATQDESDMFNFYHPEVMLSRDERDGGDIKFFADITDLIPELEGDRYFDQLRVFIFIAYYQKTSPTEIATTNQAGLVIRQLNLLEGYDVGIDGLKDNKVQIDNSSVNGTIPLAYTDAVKRQNLYGISSTAPTNGWGTEQVDQDGFGNDISTDYIMATIPDGELVGDLGPVNASEYKKEIARSVPAVSCYDQEGKETLVKIGDFPDENLALLTWQMVKLDTLKIVNYSPRYIQPSLSFKFGTKRLQINNVEADTYNASYVIDELGLSSTEKQYLWRAGHALYEKYGQSTTQKEETYKLVQDADGAYRVARALYANMGYVDGTLWPRVTITAELIDNNYFDIGTAIEIDTPKITGRGVVTEPAHAIYGATNTIKIEAIDTEEQEVTGDILQTGSQTDDVLQTGSQSDDILQTGSN